jgi:hypothetical protein
MTIWNRVWGGFKLVYTSHSPLREHVRRSEVGFGWKDGGREEGGEGRERRLGKVVVCNHRAVGSLWLEGMYHHMVQT